MLLLLPVMRSLLVTLSHQSIRCMYGMQTAVSNIMPILAIMYMTMVMVQVQTSPVILWACPILWAVSFMILKNIWWIFWMGNGMQRLISLTVCHWQLLWACILTTHASIVWVTSIMVSRLPMAVLLCNTPHAFIRLTNNICWITKRHSATITWIFLPAMKVWTSTRKVTIF